MANVSQIRTDIRGSGVFNNPNLSRAAKTTFGVLMLFADVNGRCTLQHKQLMEQLNVSQSSIVRATKELVEAGAIRRKRTSTTVHYQIVQ
jgi:DNA-binding MarR family transcriptional regulator